MMNKANGRMMNLTDDELSALICACQFADQVKNRSRVRPPWIRFGTSAHKKLIQEEFDRANRNKPTLDSAN
jgi:hypothetical protein